LDFLVKWFVDNLTKGLGNVIKEMISLTYDVFNIYQVNEILDLFFYLGGVLLAVGILFAITSFSLSQIEGNKQDFGWFIKNIILSIIAFFFVKPAAIELYNFGMTMQNQIVSIFNSNANVSKNNYVNIDLIVELVSLKTPTSTNPQISVGSIIGVAYLILFIYLVFKVIFSLYKRAVIFLLHLCIVPLHLFSIPSGNYDGFLTWCRISAGLIGANILQVATYLLSVTIFTKISIDNPVKSLVIATAFLVTAGNVDRLFMYFGIQPSSPGAGAYKAVSAMNTVVSLSRLRK
jgi:hypothetical protein